MTVVKTIVDQVADALDEVLQSLKNALGIAAAALDVNQMLARLQPLMRDLASLIVDLAPMPADTAFLVPDGVAPQAGQAGYDEFARLVVEAVTDVWAPSSRPPSVRLVPQSGVMQRVSRLAMR